MPTSSTRSAFARTTPRSMSRCCSRPSRSLFGTRHLDATEHHEGMVAAIAFESRGQAARVPRRRRLRHLRHVSTASATSSSAAPQVPDAARAAAPLGGAERQLRDWASLTILSMLAIMFLPRQFQVTVVENVDERHLRKRDLAVPALPAADQRVRPADRARRAAALPAGARRCRHVRADAADGASSSRARAARVRRRPVGRHRHGDRRDDRALDDGLQRPRDAAAAAAAAAAARRAARPDRRCCSRIRRGAIVASLLLGYLYFRLAGEAYALVSIGLISFAAVAQFAPAILGGMYWKGGTRLGALAGSPRASWSGPTRCCCRRSRKSGWLPHSVPRRNGPFGIELLRAVAALRPARARRHRALRCSGACSPTSAATSASRSLGAPERRRAQPGRRCSSTSSGAAGGRRLAVLARHARRSPDLQALLGTLPRARARATRCSRLRARAGLRTSRDELRRRRATGPLRRALLAGAIGARVGARHGRLGRRGGAARPRRGAATSSTRPRRCVAYSRAARAEVARARGGDRRAARGQRAAAGARPAEGRLHLDGHPRAAHAADLDPRVLRDPAATTPSSTAPSAAVPRHHRQGEPSG